MGDYPQPVRDAAIKCVPCNAPAVETVAGDYVCVECGRRPVTSFDGAEPPSRRLKAQQTADD